MNGYQPKGDINTPPNPPTSGSNAQSKTKTSESDNMKQCIITTLKEITEALKDSDIQEIRIFARQLENGIYVCQIKVDRT